MISDLKRELGELAATVAQLREAQRLEDKQREIGDLETAAANPALWVETPSSHRP